MVSPQALACKGTAKCAEPGWPPGPGELLGVQGAPVSRASGQACGLLLGALKRSPAPWEAACETSLMEKLSLGSFTEELSENAVIQVQVA